MMLSMFNEFSKLKMLTIAETRFVAHIVMLKRFKLIKQSLQGMVMSDQWSAYKKDNIGQAEIVRKDFLMNFGGTRYYSDSWINEDANNLPPHRDAWVSEMRNVCLEKLFPAADDLKTVKEEYAEFTHLGIEYFSMDSIIDRDILDPKTWWVTHGASVPKLQSLALKLLSLPASSSCYERNWSTYSLIHKIMKSKSRPVWASDLVFVHTNLRLRARTLDEYYTHSESWLWDVEKDCFVANLVAGVLEFATLSLDEPEFELAMMEEAERNDDDRV
ncbi:hypothetical protein PR202_ga04679 [Eleusine coracana subsp. coracana]|uniref:HAT C-terminal dimerisation domain-containing protein n=1 Tax=Eleusine coracana subsp. coracana TaxID=191504 RepID=A0AAV5BS81_ELECO|nr:hypothetical protein PR202_ga04679 [Eleusine coracana subsp. coracana]